MSDDYTMGYDDGSYDNDDIINEKDKEIAALVATNMTLWEQNERLRAENEKLRAALKPFLIEHWPDHKVYGYKMVFVTPDDLRAAAAALKETGDE